MKKAISYLYREILLKVNEELTKYYSDEYEEDEKAREAIDTFRLEFLEANLEDVEKFDEDKCNELYKSTIYYSWIGDIDIVREVVNELRYGEFNLSDEVDEDRYYSNREVGSSITGLEDTYLAWTYYFGGGKWGEPEAVEWMDDCYLVVEKEEVKLVKVYEKIKE